ncbi:MAG: Gfo/Idh/MocA family protein [Nocardioidaceae bacterium]
MRVGVVGCGYWGSKHVRTLGSLESVSEVVAIDPDVDRVASLFRTVGGMASYPTVASALGAVDAVVIATPPSTHLPLALEAIAAGKHVMVEKPLAPSVAEARMMVTAAAEAGVTLMVGHTFEFHSAVWSLRDMVRSGQLGDLYYLDTARLNLGLYQQDVNVVFDLAPHDVSILNYVLGRQPVSVECWASRHAHRRLEDIAYMRLYYEDPGCVAHVHVSWLDPKKVRRVTVVGSSKMVVFDDLASEERIRIHDKGVEAPADADGNLTEAPMSYRYGDIVAPYLEVNEPLRVEDEHFVDCIQTGMRPVTDGENGLAVVEVLEAAVLSFEQSRAVRIDEVRSRPLDSRPEPMIPEQARAGAREAL